MEEKKKFTYEELEQNYANAVGANIQLSQALKQAEERFNSIQMATMRLEFLLKVLNCKMIDSFDGEFISKCIGEVQALMTVESSEESKEN